MFFFQRKPVPALRGRKLPKAESSEEDSEEESEEEEEPAKKVNGKKAKEKVRFTTEDSVVLNSVSTM